ncbi:MAG: GntR family transcriptional regulator [Armatimonadota bacterium]|nr:GntR family transcriptional regulator [Armatimonadota bacterium]MDR7452141.1 GntR family transcriptional regulator [Armatimonadota bacterium]MDR7467865.1 GntR family transcriptional regulator [Armatimonadota bacterium]MDR7494753.1 GntR family transcriptional regulator [Armatimonadota bacterium]MDR7499578.1 GntR family transcriptional regulator [Armatimonadota bacterium]
MTDLLLTENLPARELVFRKLREAILSGRFQPGQRLRERELVGRMGVSRTPIREALRKLELEGLVTTVPYRGPVVTRPTLDSARELYETRAALEGQATALFTLRADEEAVERLRRCIRDAERALQRRRPEGILAANNAFHDTIAAGCGNGLLQGLIANLRDRIVLLRVESLSYPGRRSRSISEHKAIVRMIERRDAPGARALVEEHIMHAWRAARAQLLLQGRSRGRNG